ncbi:TadE/TadG family type IV pilus assembly protein [Croceicoccus gelatinilyticus]|uniref:TadE/TadG family type IV pilus assembly protein n=1 Tax=Croceicoccus gelatinilyticus TaxID=2835536 RepID=UPI001BCE686E|nr:TadE/TadG family type IV pilus assembly protein [Croceicoccus gelatinilyticus]MBS7670735.1 pilus assembly protein [Croceicoccus gelatinilyticus]
MTLRDFINDESGSPAAEFVLSLPMILPLIFVAMEAGNFFWSQQKLVESVRNGARYAARLSYTEVCNPSGSGYAPIAAALETKIKNLTRTGNTAGTGPAELPGWTNAQVTVSVDCGGFVSTGIFDTLGSDSGGNARTGAVVTVAAPSVPYFSILGALGVINSSYRLAAESHAPVIGV